MIGRSNSSIHSGEMLRKSASTTAQALAFSRRAISKIVRKALPFPGMPW